ncbi:MAG: protein TolQ [Saccharospirillaceae bacterium]|nr:protein TolQ [Pseudomonadales bacterium]NRB78547.1 protein TolQ [Saccharospirillaceae bacterium]
MSIVVLAVMAILVLASVFTWVIIIERVRKIRTANKALFLFEERFWSGMDLTQLYKQVYNDPDPEGGAEAIFRSGFKEFTRLRQQIGVDPESIMVGTHRAMRVVAKKEADKLDKHLSFLATAGSITPYIGLLGTVWGIMNSFQGLSDASQLSLSAVAPGISEALSATAMGLFAAIPAVVAYNRFASQAESLIGSYETFAEEFTSILHRQIHIAKPQKKES